MSQTLKLTNFASLNIVTQSLLTTDVAAGVLSLPVENSAAFVAGPVLVGDPGGETTELVNANAPSAAGTVPLSSSTVLPHNAREAVYMLFGSQIQIYSAADQYGNGQQPDDANFTLVATVTIDPSQKFTTYTDPNGAVGTWYKYTYFSTVSGTSTALSSSGATQAGQVHYVNIDDIREAAGFGNNPNVTDKRISDKRAAAEREINGALIPVYQFPLPQPTNPIIVEITKQLAAGMLIHELYVNVSPAMAAEGEAKANSARNGGGSFTGLQELVTQAVVLTDAQFNDTSTDENVHGFGGWPDDTTNNMGDDGGTSDGVSGGDDGSNFFMDKVY